MKYPTYCWLRYLLDCHIKYIHLVLYWPPLEGGRKRRRPILKLLVWANVPPKIVVDIWKTCVVAFCWIITFYNYICVRRLPKRCGRFPCLSVWVFGQNGSNFRTMGGVDVGYNVHIFTFFILSSRAQLSMVPRYRRPEQHVSWNQGGGNEIRQRHVRRGMSEVFRANVRTTDWVGSVLNTII